MRKIKWLLMMLSVVSLGCRSPEKRSFDFGCGASPEQPVQGFELEKDFPDNALGRRLAAIYHSRRANADPAFWWPFVANKRLELSFAFTVAVSADERAIVLEAAREWEKFAHVRFVESASKPKIRILLTASKASWSEIGTRALARSEFSPTMWLGLRRAISREEKKIIALHEFGHALGLNHEHQHPCVNIQWLETVMEKDLKGQLTLAQIREGIIKKYASSEVVESDAFDTDSIMLYPIHSTWTKNGVSFVMGHEISPEDSRFVASMYPPRGERKIPVRGRKPASC